MIVALEQKGQPFHQVVRELFVQKIAVDLLRSDGLNLFLKKFKKTEPVPSLY